MTDCSNADIRDLLADVAQDALDAASHGRVMAHVDSCDTCAAELALLRVARAIRPAAAPIDVARIVAALPARATAPRPALVLASPPSVSRPSVSRPSVRAGRRFVPAGVWRMAAAVAVVAVGGWAVIDAGGGVRGTIARDPASPVLAESVASVSVVSTAGDSAPLAAPDSGTSVRSAAVGPAVAVTAEHPALSIGDLSEYSDAELERMLDRLEKWDGATSAEPVPTVPLLPAMDRGAGR